MNQGNLGRISKAERERSAGQPDLLSGCRSTRVHCFGRASFDNDRE